jgi:hypothetical protein
VPYLLVARAGKRNAATSSRPCGAAKALLEATLRRSLLRGVCAKHGFRTVRETETEQRCLRVMPREMAAKRRPEYATAGSVKICV